MTVRLLTEHHLEFLSLKEASQARLSLNLQRLIIALVDVLGVFTSEIGFRTPKI